jgi:hypothetical protein
MAKSTPLRADLAAIRKHEKLARFNVAQLSTCWDHRGIYLGAAGSLHAG